MSSLKTAHLVLPVARFVGLAALIGLCLAVVRRRRGADAAAMRSLFPSTGGPACADAAVVWA